MTAEVKQAMAANHAILEEKSSIVDTHETDPVDDGQSCLRVTGMP